MFDANKFSLEAISVSFYTATALCGTSYCFGFYSVQKQIAIPRSFIGDGLFESLERTAKEMELNMEKSALNQNTKVEQMMNDFLANLSYVSDVKSREVSSVVREQIERGKNDNLKMLQKYRIFLREKAVIPLQKRLSLSHNGESTSMVKLTEDAMVDIRSEYFGFEKQMMEERNRLRLDSINEVSKAIINIHGKQEILNFSKKLSAFKFSKDELKQLELALDFDLSKKSVPSENFQVLERVAAKLDNSAKSINRTREIIFSDSIYKFCNYPYIGILFHLGTFGFCSGYTLGANIDVGSRGDSGDLNGLANIFRFILTLSGVYSMSGIMEVFYKLTFFIEGHFLGLFTMNKK